MLTTRIFNKGKIYIQYKTGNDKKIISTNISADVKSWSNIKRYILPSDENYKQKNDSIDSVQKKWENLILEYNEQNGFKPSATIAKNLFISRKDEIIEKEQSSLIDYFVEFSDEKKREFTLSNKLISFKDYGSTLTVLKLYEAINNKKILISDMANYSWVLKFDEFLAKEKELPKGYPFNMRNGQQEKTRKKRFSVLITFAEWLKDEKNFKYDFSSLKKRSTKIDIPKKIREVVRLDELNKFIEFEFQKKNHIRVADMFIVANHLGLRFADLITLNKSDFVMKQNNHFLIKQTQKTDERVTVPLTDICEKIMKKYDFEFPKITNQEANRYLHQALKLTGLFDDSIITESGEKVPRWKEITFHSARRSFITTLINDNVSVNAVMKFTGHTQISTLEKYLNPNFDVLKEHIGIFEKK